MFSYFVRKHINHESSQVFFLFRSSFGYKQNVFIITLLQLVSVNLANLVIYTYLKFHEKIS